ncbi:MAG: 4Fe-4S dicluster domain-containing protein [Anaerolineae bacterium]|nr:4Fe-4S dicluster domain-containing protein [Anaerolineae bacterium]MDQ7035898.1 4Fe-4S dicluster domain-containing protein [Anaerolineae bacterium]
MVENIAEEIRAVRIDDACVICGGCALVCPTNALMLEDDGIQVKLHLNPQDCISCEACVDTCAHYAIDLDWVDSVAGIVAESAWVYCRGCGERLANRAEIDVMCMQLAQAGFSEELLEFTANFCTSCKYHRAGILKR